jgi:LysR family transcriptional regulator, hydrogen peroxide-inducible genes activator
MRPTIRQLEYAVAVADAGHFGRAAAACGVSQPGLSTQLRQLEDQLGVRIFERTSRRVVLTPAGARVVAAARDVLMRCDDLAEVASAAREPLAGVIRLGVIPTVGPYLLPRALPRVRKEYPKLRLVLREEQTDRLVAALRDGKLDAILVALPLAEVDLEAQPLFREPFLVAMPAGHRLARRGAHGTLREADLAGEDVLLLEDGHCLRAQALQVCQRAGAREPGRLHATSLGTLVQMVANGLGITLVPASAAAVEIRPDAGLALKAFAPPAPAREIGLAWRKASARGAEFRLLGDALARHAPDAGQDRPATKARRSAAKRPRSAPGRRRPAAKARP